MPITPRLDTPGGSDFEGYPVRNVGRLAVGQSALPDTGIEFQVAGQSKLQDLDVTGVAGSGLVELVQDIVAAMLASTGATVSISYNDTTGIVNLESAAGFNATAIQMYR